MGIKQSLTEAGLMKAYDILAKNQKEFTQSGAGCRKA